jgi:hypothetical protein
MSAGEGRAKRRCVLRKRAVPSAAHYVGYVEDEETPEMIMRKFEEMERILAGHAPAAGGGACGGGSGVGAQQLARDGSGDGASAGASGHQQQQSQGEEEEGDADGGGALGEAQLRAIFKATSIFNVRSVLGGNEALLSRSGAGARPGGGGGSGSWGGSGGWGAGDRAVWSDGELCSGVGEGGGRPSPSIWRPVRLAPALAPPRPTPSRPSPRPPTADEERSLLEELRGFWSDDDEWGGPAKR